MKISELFETLQAMVDKATVGPDVEAVIGVNITEPDPAQWQAVVKSGKAILSDQVLSEPDLTLSVSSETALKLFNRELNPMMALMTGKVKVKGDLGKIAAFKALLSKRK